MTFMHLFDESALARELDGLAPAARTAFAAAAATRQLRNWERLAAASAIDAAARPREIAQELWSALASGSAAGPAWAARLAEVMGLLPEEADNWTMGHTLADDALSSLAYAIRCHLSPSSQDAAWAARRAYEAADQAAIRMLGVQPGTPDSEQAIGSHDLVQRELARQRQDLARLRSGDIEAVRRMAVCSDLLTDQEAARVH